MIITRRNFIKGAAVFLLAAKGKNLLDFKNYTEETLDIMGTQARIAVLHGDIQHAQMATTAAFEELQRIDSLMSNFKESSEISQLNNNGFLHGMSKETINAINKANYYSALTDGAFDISIQSLLESGATQNVNYRGIQISGADVELQPGMRITLGGIGIGHAVDTCTDILKKSGIEHALVNIGGDIKAIGGKGDKVAWKVGIKNPNNRDEYLSVMDVLDNSIATSGNYEKPHILDPHTGKQPDGLKSVTVMTKECIDADALSTAIFVLGPKMGLELARKINASCVLVTEDSILKVMDSRVKRHPYNA